MSDLTRSGDDSGASAAVADLALSQAAEWFAVLRDGDAGPSARSQWERWHSASARNREAWQRIESVGRRFGALSALGASAEAGRAVAALQAARRMPPRRRALRSIALLAGAGLAGAAAWRGDDIANFAAGWRADVRTATGEQRRLALADGTGVWLNTASAISVDFGPALRSVKLLAGEILLQCVRDPCPLVVDTAHGRLRALGTRFTVRHERPAALVAVQEGAVEVRPAMTAAAGGSASSAPEVIQAGRQLWFDRRSCFDAGPADGAREAWTRGVLLAQDITLAALMRELGRYRHGHVALHPDVAGLRVFGGFPLAEPDRVFTLLEAALPVRVRRVLPWWVAIEPRETS